MADNNNVMLNGEYAGAGLWKKEFTNKDWGVTKTLSGAIKLDAPITEGEYWVTIYPNDNMKSDNSPAFNLYIKPKEVKAEAAPSTEKEADPF